MHTVTEAASGKRYLCGDHQEANASINEVTKHPRNVNLKGSVRERFTFIQSEMTFALLSLGCTRLR